MKDPLKDNEIEMLNQQLAQIDKRSIKGARFLIVWTLLTVVIATFAFFKMGTKADVIILLLTAIIFIGIGVWVMVENNFKERKLKKSIVYLKNKNLVTVIEVVSDRFYELKEEDDEGVYYLFQINENEVFSFGGQDFYPNKKFPNNRFEIVEGRGIKNEVLLLETFCYGEKIHPIKIFKGQEKWNLLGSVHYPDPEKLTIINGKIEDYLQIAASTSS